MNIGLLVYPGCVTSGLFAFAELLEMANQRSGQSQFEVIWVGADMQAVPLKAGGQQPVVSLSPQTTLLDKNLDAILVPGFWTRDRKELKTQLNSHRSLVETLKRLPASRDVWSYCSAVCLLAAAGRLDQQDATCTWWLADYLQQTYSNVHWNFSQTCIFTGNNLTGKNATASGINGYLSIALELVTKHCGPEVLRDIVDLMVLPKPETNLQPFQLIHVMKLEDKLMKKIFVWVERTAATDLSVSALAKALHQTERTLARRVKTETQLSCAQFMRLIKMNQASEYLRYSAQPISAISDRLGFSDDAAFRRSFKKVSTYTPGDYRQTFKR